VNSNQTAVVLFQLGGLDSLDAIAPFLFDLFMDADTLDFPLAGFVRNQMAKAPNAIACALKGEQETTSVEGGQHPELVAGRKGDCVISLSPS